MTHGRLEQEQPGAHQYLSRPAHPGTDPSEVSSYDLACDAKACAQGLDLSLSATGNVAFDSERKQWAYGVRALFEVKGWSDDSPFARFNLLDNPFAALRALTGYESCDGGGSACFVPRGTSLPTLLVGLARVSPEDDDPRALTGATDDFDRLRFEASFRTPIARVGEDRLYVSANYR